MPQRERKYNDSVEALGEALTGDADFGIDPKHRTGWR